MDISDYTLIAISSAVVLKMNKSEIRFSEKNELKRETENEKEEIETATVKIVASKTDENGVIYNKFTAVFMGVVFESKAKGEL